jgi:hypothetical protein
LPPRHRFRIGFCDKKFSNAQQANDFGASLGFPFKGVPIKLGFDSSSQKWSEWYSDFCSSVKQDEYLQLTVREHVESINDQVIQGFNSCIQAHGLHVWIEQTSDPKEFVFATRFNSPNPQNPEAKITTFDPGANVACKETPSTVSAAVWRTRCHRSDDSSVTFVVNADWAPHGGGKLTLPAIAKYTPPPRAEKIKNWKTGTITAAGKVLDSFVAALNKSRVLADGVKIVWNPPPTIHYAIRQGDNRAVIYKWLRTSTGSDRELEVQIQQIVESREIIPIGVTADHKGFLYLTTEKRME